MAKKLKTQEERLPSKFIPGDKAYLIPKSYDERYENIDFASEYWEGLNSDYEYEVEGVVTKYIKKMESDVQHPYRDLPLTYLQFVHDVVCGGSGYWMPAYRFWTKKEYLAQKKKT